MIEKLWSSSDIAEYLGLSAKHVQDRVVCHPKFPRRICIPTIQGKSKPRWKQDEVVDWVTSHQEKRAA